MHICRIPPRPPPPGPARHLGANRCAVLTPTAGSPRTRRGWKEDSAGRSTPALWDLWDLGGREETELASHPAAVATQGCDTHSSRRFPRVQSSALKGPMDRRRAGAVSGPSL